MIDGACVQRYVLMKLNAFIEERFSAMSKIRCIFFLSLATLSLNAISETYKCRSPDGKISYSGQISLTPGVKCEQIFVKKQPVVVQEQAPAEHEESVGPVDIDSSSPPQKKADKPSAKSPDTAEAKDKKTDPKTTPEKLPEKSASDKQAEQKLKDENCQAAKANLRTYQVGGRVSKVNESGEKVYLDDAEIKQKTQEAQKEVDKWCNS